MTSTPHNSQSTEPGQPSDLDRLFQPILQSPLVQRLRFKSIGTRLFVTVMTGGLIGIGSMAFLFGEIVKFQAEGEIQQSVNDKAATLTATLGQAETLAKATGTSILNLHQQKAESPETYRNLILESFKNRPDFATGIGFGQSENGVLTERQWFFSYYTLDSGDINAIGQSLSLSNQAIRYSTGTEPNNFYPETNRYQNYFLPQKDIWSPPITTGDRTQSTFYSPILNSQGRWLGTVFVDFNTQAFDSLLSTPVIYQDGFFALLTTEGSVVAAPTTPTLTSTDLTAANSETSSETNLASTYQSIPGLAAVWTEITKGESGLVEGDRGYWSYARMPGTNLITIAFVPYRAIFSRVALLTTGGTITVGLLLAIVVALVVRYLNHRLRPILQECNQFVTADSEALTLSQHQDEIGQLSIGFFNLLDQLKMHQEQIHQETARAVAAETQLQQIETSELEKQTLQSNLNHLFNVIAAIEQGNLTVTIPTSSELPSIVTETLQHLIERLTQSMAIVLNAAVQVNQGATELEQLSIDTAQNVQQQTQSITQVQTLIENTYKLSQEAALQATTTNEAVQVSQSALFQGQQKLTAITQSITVLEQDTNQIVKRTQTLTNYVELATQFAKDQKRIAAMTRILAVNASMLASRASAQQDPEQLAVITREFETIAAQVNTLASQTNQSLVLLQQRTDQIQTVVSGLNHDVQEISQQVDTLTSGVDQSRKAFDTIRTVNEQVVQMGQQIVQSSQTIANTTQTALESVQDVATIASITLNQSDITQKQAHMMKGVSQTLLHKLEFYQFSKELSTVNDQTNKNQTNKEQKE